MNIGLWLDTPGCNIIHILTFPTQSYSMLLWLDTLGCNIIHTNFPYKHTLTGIWIHIGFWWDTPGFNIIHIGTYQLSLYTLLYIVCSSDWTPWDVIFHTATSPMDFMYVNEKNTFSYIFNPFPHGGILSPTPLHRATIDRAKRQL